jgi:hypothetical protein
MPETTPAQQPSWYVLIYPEHYSRTLPAGTELRLMPGGYLESTEPWDEVLHDAFSTGREYVGFRALDDDHARALALEWWQSPAVPIGHPIGVESPFGHVIAAVLASEALRPAACG